MSVYRRDGATRSLVISPSKGPFSIVFETAVGSASQSSLRFQRTHSIPLSDYERVCVSLGCLGLIRVGDDVYVGIVTDAYKVAELERNDVYRILKVAFYSLLSNEFDHVDAVPEPTRMGSNIVGGFVEDATQSQIVHPCTPLAKMLSSGSYYFSPSLDLTRSTQRRYMESSADVKLAAFIFDTYDSHFIWNHHMLSSILQVREQELAIQERDDMDRSGLFVLIIQGFFGSTNTYIGSLRVQLAILSRLSCKRAGTRFNARGIDDDGNVSNFVETEMMLFYKDSIFSFLQIRGSVPVFWEQNGLQVPQKIDISRGPESTTPAIRKHFKELEERYERVHVINLLMTKEGGAEALLGDAFRNQLQILGGNIGVKYTSFDFHAIVKGNNYDKATAILDYVSQSLESFGSFQATKGSVVLVQQGIIRTNCLDCLDRTNVIQCILAKSALEQFILQFDSRASLNEENFLNAYNGIWADNGDWLSKIYAGTGAIKSSLTRKGKQTVLGFLDDAAKSVNRFYINNFQDKGKQEAIDMLLGKFGSYTSLLLLNPLHKTVADELYRRRMEYSTSSNITILLNTWNVNGKLPYGDSTYSFLQWKGENPHIIVIGIQELIELTAGQLVTADTEKLRALWEAHLHRSINHVFGPNYVLIRSVHLVALGIFAFARSDGVGIIRNVEVSIVKTGLGGMAGNKGGIGLSLSYNDTSIVFITAHLAAGEKSVEERNRDYWTITNGLKFRRKTLDDHDAIFWFGDFNYRVDLPNEEVRSRIQRGDLNYILNYDQLNLQKLDNVIFPQFVEGPIKFEPSYKYDNGTTVYDTSEKGRTPSWTDRILYKGKGIDLVLYDRSECLISDHRPVRAIFKLEVIAIDAALRDKLKSALYQTKNKHGGPEMETIRLERTVPYKPARPPSVAVLIDLSDTDPFPSANPFASSGDALVQHHTNTLPLPQPSSITNKWWNNPIDETWVPRQGDSKNPFYSFPS